MSTCHVRVAKPKLRHAGRGQKIADDGQGLFAKLLPGLNTDRILAVIGYFLTAAGTPASAAKRDARTWHVLIGRGQEQPMTAKGFLFAMRSLYRPE